ncbi:fibronectin type III domain-containing protein [Janthinobacterium sp. SUN118]|uniref:fibronectin type III domain-containing protein n=1 Tax=Janthinobacterium sp. SUN118 TaxID=3004100 RepID=UPI0025B2440F|nr:fibronectin type III domain-containing protein [Janthinobacterium sp. SUN118]MDN2710095.1 fibronectin type III domain-containing protein [Janthinobacterium sp. SUN118]
MQVTCPIAVAALVILSGCSSLPGTKFGLSTEAIMQLVPGSNTELQEKLKATSSDFDAALNVCRKKMKENESRIARTSTAEVGIVTVGIIAGSIVVPALAAKAAAKSAIAAWGGVSGAANGYQYAATQRGIDSAQYAAASSVMSTKIALAMTQYGNAKTNPTEAANAVAKLIVACEFPSPAEISAAMPANAPDAPKDAAFEAGANGSGTIKITPPDNDGGANITDYLVSIHPSGPILSPADFRDRAHPFITVTSLTASQEYQLLIRAQNRIGASGGIVKIIPKGAK